MCVKKSAVLTVLLFFCVSGADSEKRSEQLERTSSISEEYMRYLNNPENEEKRFPVDRKKLERLILGESVIKYYYKYGSLIVQFYMNLY